VNKWTWLEEARGLARMVGDTGSVSGKDFRIAVQVIDKLIEKYLEYRNDDLSDCSAHDAEAAIRDDLREFTDKLR